MKDIKKINLEEDVFDLEWDEDKFRCDGCSRELSSDEGTVASGGMVYCDECAKDLHHCASCNILVSEDDPHGIDYENYYCEDCAENFTRCEYCDSVVDKEEYLVEYSGSNYCKFCFEEALGGFICAGCGAECTEDDGEEGKNGERYCYDCLDQYDNGIENFPRCEYCDELITNKENQINCQGVTYCEYCFEHALGGFICHECHAACTDADGEKAEDGEYYCYNCLEEMSESK